MNTKRTIENSKRRRSPALSRHSGFTLLEILIVIAIAGLISAITLSGFGSISASTRRTTCQTNLTQIYQACRLYQNDHGTFPPYSPPSSDDVAFTSPSTPLGQDSIGLLSLYVNTSTGVDSAVVAQYLRKAQVFHCPADTDPGHSQFVLGNAFNKDYISYQQRDAEGIDSDPGGYLYPCETYRPVRLGSPGGTIGRRELIPWDGSRVAPRPPDDTTVVTWCFHHRKALGGRNYDNVLFYDGSVQLIPRVQDSGATAWQRLPRLVN